METIYLGAITGFILGTFGYTIVQFVIRPIFRYKKIKRKTVSDLNTYLNVVYNENEDPVIHERIDECANDIRQRSSELTDCYEDILPTWYKLLLKRRGESPIDASKHLTVLANTKNYKHAQDRTEKIQQTLRF